MPVTARRVVLAGVLAGLGCRGPSDQTLVLVLESTTGTLESMTAIAQLSEAVFPPDAALGSVDQADARSPAVDRARGNIEGLLGLFTCDAEPVITTDGTTFIQVALAECRDDLIGAELDGTIRADLSFDTAPCAAGDCPTAARWDLSSPDAARVFVARVGTTGLRFSAPVHLRFDLDATMPRTFSTELVGIDTPSDQLSTRAEAEWRLDGCVALDVDAILEQRVGAENPATASAYPVVFTVRELVDCLGECPRSGDVLLSYADGLIVTWTHAATPVVVVMGPHGAEVETELECR